MFTNLISLVRRVWIITVLLNVKKAYQELFVDTQVTIF
jgi:hypothetical protein